MTISPIQNSALSTEHSLENLQQAVAHNKTYTFTKNKDGTVEISLKKLGLFARIGNWFSNSQRDLAKSFIDQTLNVVDNRGVSKDLRKMILLNVTDNNSTSDTFIRVVKKAHAKKKMEEIQAKFATALDHLKEPSTPGARIPQIPAFRIPENRQGFGGFPNVRFPSPVREEVQPNIPQALKKEAIAFESKFKQGQPVTLFDSKPFVEYHYKQRLAGQPGNSHLLSQLRKYYADSHQAGGFEEIEVATRSEVLARARAQLSGSASDLCRDVVKDIKNKAKEHPSIHGHPRDLYTREDLANLKAIEDKFPLTSTVHLEASEQLNKIHESVEKSNQTLRKYSSLFQRLEGNKQSLPLILDAKKALMEIELSSGSYVELDLLREHPLTSEKNKKGLENLIALGKIRGPHIDQAMLLSFIDEHNQARVHPRVAIEGAGPTGLLLAITQLRSGADVSIFEKRSTKFDRTQIVRLDPKWMSMLKVYLGEDYYRLFIDAGKKGILRSDGFGEISTMELEDVLHTKLTQLISHIPNVKGKVPPLERLAAHEITELNPPAVKGGKFQIVADYSERYDVATGALKERSPDHQVREIDMMICAGGKSSPMKDKFLPSSAPVNNKQNYGVCSWVSHTIPGQDTEKMDLFADFRNMIKVDNDFRNRFRTALNEHFSADSIVGSTVSERLMKGFQDQMNSPQFRNFMSLGPFQPYIQTRTFENRGLIYIGMEMPAEVNDLFNNFEVGLDIIISGGDPDTYYKQFDIQNLLFQLDAVNFHIDYAFSDSSINFYQGRKHQIENQLNTLRAELETKSPGHAEMTRQKQFMMEMMKKVWFQNIMDTYGLSQKHQLTMDTIDTKFAAMFPVEQNRMHQEHSFSNIKSGTSELLVLAAGDAFASPHFMRYSGLTGARENILDYQNYTRHMTHDQRPDQRGLLDSLRRKGDRTATFVIERGKAFLTPKSQSEIEKARKAKMIELLDKEVADKNPRPYTVKKIGHEKYEAQKGFQKVLVQPKEGFFRVEGSPKTYESFEQIKLEMQLL